MSDALGPHEGPSRALFETQTVFGHPGAAAPEMPSLDLRPSPQPGDVIGSRYRVRRQLGRGGMGQVCEVVHERLGKVFALKRMVDDSTPDEEARRAFYREARFASSLRHPQIPSVVDYGEDSRWGAFMVMEYVEGENVRELVERRGAMSDEAAADLMMQVADALHYVHQRELVHGDIKADNVIVTAEGGARQLLAKLVDFGLARTRAQHASEDVHGTLAYIAPERIHRAPPSQAADIYALGVLFYYALTGRHPYMGDTNAVLRGHLKGELPPLQRSGGPPVTPEIEAVVRRCLAVDPSERPASVGHLVGELRTALRGLGAPSRRGQSAAPGTGELLAATFAHFILPIAVIDAGGRVETANAAFGRLFTGVGGDLSGTLLINTPLAAAWPGLLEDIENAAGGGIVRRVVADESTRESYLVWLEPSPVDGLVTVGAHPVV